MKGGLFSDPPLNKNYLVLIKMFGVDIMSEHKKQQDKRQDKHEDKRQDKQEGKQNFDINKLLQNVDLNEIMNIMGNLNLPQNNGKKMKREKRIEVLNAVKPLLTAEKSDIVDTIIQLYFIKKIISH